MVDKFKTKQYEDMREEDITNINKKYGTIEVSEKSARVMENFINEVYDYAFQKGKTDN